MNDQHRIQLPTGAKLFEQGEIGDCAYIIETGEIEISSRSPEGADLHLASLASGSLVGEMALIDGGPRTATAVALTDVTLVQIPKSYLTRLIDNADPTITLLMKVILKRYRSVKARYDEFGSDYPGHGLHLPMVENSDEFQLHANRAVDQIIREKELRNAIDNSQLELFYQPICDLRRGRVVGCEALIRWIDPVNGVIPPNLFISLAEETGLIEELGLLVFKQADIAIKEFRTLVGEAEPEFFISLNLSSKQIETDAQVERLFNYIESEQMDLHHTKIEITETLLMSDQERVNTVLHRFKALGAQISLDDFGTGYSSFSYLHQFPIDTIKIDQSFVFSMHENEKSEAIVRSLCSLAVSLGMKTVAEGVETLESEINLKSFGCDYSQGYFYSRPLPKADFIAMTTRLNSPCVAID